MANKNYEILAVTASLQEKGFKLGEKIEMDSVLGDEWCKFEILKEFSLADKEAEEAREKALDIKVEKDIAGADAAAAAILETIFKKLGDKIGKKNMDDLFKANAKSVKDEGEKEKMLNFGQLLKGLAAKAGAEFKGYKESLSLLQKAVTGQAEGTDAIGGFLVDTDFDKELDTRLMETNILLPLTDIRTIQPGSNGMKWNGATDYDRTDTNHLLEVFYITEAGNKTPSIANFEQLTLDLLKLVGLNYQTDELLQDTSNLMADIIEWFSNEFGWKIDNGIFEGGGGAALTGCLGHASNIAVARAGAGAVVVGDVQNIFARFWSRSKQNLGSTWLINPDVSPDLNGMTLGDQPIYLPAGGVSANPFGILLGRSVREFEHCKSVGTLGDINLVDMSQYRTIQKGGIETLTSQHVRFVNDETVVRMVKRINGRPKWTTVQTPQNGTSTVSPFVSLAT